MFLGKQKRCGAHYVVRISPYYNLEEPHRYLDALELGIVSIENRSVVHAYPALVSRFFLDAFFKYIGFDMPPVAIISKSVPVKFRNLWTCIGVCAGHVCG